MPHGEIRLGQKGIIMKMTKLGTTTALIALFASTLPLRAVVGQFLEVQGTNLILSWPSLGYEEYMILYRPTLDPSTPWTVLANNYFANSTSFTTFVITGAIPATLATGSGSGGTEGGGIPEIPMAERTAMSTELMAAPADGSGPAVPFVIYPPGWDTNGLVFFEVEVPQPSASPLRGEANRAFSPNSAAAAIPDGGSGDSQDPPSSGFYQVWHIPDFLADVEGYAFDGPYFIPVDFKDYVDKVDSIQVLINGEPTPYSEFTYILDQSGNTNWGVGIYFDRMPNGPYQIQLATTLRIGSEVGDDTVYLALTNIARDIIVSNQVTFTNWNDLVLSGSYTFTAQTLNTNTDWEIDIYDASGNYVNSGFGTTTDGQLSWAWDLYDYLGNLRDDDGDPFFQGYISFNTTGSASPSVGMAPDGSGGTTRPTPALAAQYPSVGSWLISYSDRFYLDQPPPYPGVNSYYMSAINALCGGPAWKQDPVTPFPIAFGTNVYSQTDRNTSWLNLKSALYQPGYRNFYYFGHGNANSIGCDLHTYDSSNNVTGGAILPGSKAYLTSQWVHDNVTFNEYGGVHRYRFVFLDGCRTANGDWPDAFGIGKNGYTTTSWYKSSSNTQHIRPCAFVGWNQTVGGRGWGTVQGQWTFISDWMGNWANGGPYVAGLQNALQSGNSAAGWIDPGKFNGANVVYGYQEMLMEDYNHKGDWSWP